MRLDQEFFELSNALEIGDLGSFVILYATVYAVNHTKMTKIQQTMLSLST